MGSLIVELERQEAVARADQWRSRMEELARDLARAEERVSRLVIAREEVTRVLGEPVGGVELPSGQGREPAAAAGWPGRGSPIGVVAVLLWRAGLAVSVLPQAYQDVLEVAADARPPAAGGAVRRRGGADTDRAGVEGLRLKLKLSTSAEQALDEGFLGSRVSHAVIAEFSR
jgi:hypothetical protein